MKHETSRNDIFCSPDRLTRFLGIVTERGGSGLAAFARVRNVVERVGVEFVYNLYSPTVHKVEVLRLQKSMDDDMLFLRYYINLLLSFCYVTSSHYRS